jgi:hypothetical protein
VYDKTGKSIVIEPIALNATAAMHISGNTLELKDASGKVRLRLEACQR